MAKASMASLMDSHSSRPEALRSLGAAPPGGYRGQHESKRTAHSNFCRDFNVCWALPLVILNCPIVKHCWYSFWFYLWHNTSLLLYLLWNSRCNVNFFLSIQRPQKNRDISEQNQNNLLFPVNILTLTGHFTPISSQICKEHNIYY